MPKPKMVPAYESQPHNDYAGNMKKVADSASQSVPVEMGNNAGPGVTDETSKGKIDMKGGGSYMEGFPADAAGK